MSSRAKRSTTRKSYNETIDEEQGELLNSAEDSKFINDDSDDFEEEAPIAKKKAKTAAKGKGRRKKLEYFQDMNLDILYEICYHLDPLTLLYMSRVNRAFRNAIISPSAVSVWQNARGNVYLPDLEADDMSEASYASLIFERRCGICNKSRASKVDYYIRERYCQPCQKKNLCNPSKTRRNLYDTVGNLDQETLLIAPFTMTSSTRYVTGAQFYFQPHVVAIDKRIKELRALLNSASSEEEKIQRAQDSKDYITRRTELRAMMQKDGLAIKKWELTSAVDHAKENAAATIRRRAAIESRMEELGWTQADFTVSYGWRTHRFVLQPKDLTERIWSTIKAPLIAYLQSNKDARLRAEAEARKKKRQESLIPLYVALVKEEEDEEGAGSFPSFSDFSDFAIIKAFYESDEYVFSQKDWDVKKPEILVEVDKSRHSRKTGLFKILVNALNEIENVTIDSEILEKIAQAGYSYPIALTDEEMDPLFNLVTSRFNCASCRHCFSYRGLLQHYADVRKTTNSIRNYNSHYQDWSSAASSKRLIAACKKLIELSDLEKKESEVTEVEFRSIENLGEVFKCFDCNTTKRQSNYYGSAHTSRALRPFSSSGLIQHIYTSHNSWNDGPTTINIIRVDPVVEAAKEKARLQAETDARDAAKAQIQAQVQAQAQAALDAQAALETRLRDI